MNGSEVTGQSELLDTRRPDYLVIIGMCSNRLSNNSRMCFNHLLKHSSHVLLQTCLVAWVLRKWFDIFQVLFNSCVCLVGFDDEVIDRGGKSAVLVMDLLVFDGFFHTSFDFEKRTP